jgi:short-subunit dehydrogenase
MLRNILITGATSGLGKQIAIEYSKHSLTQTLILLGRNIERMNEVKNTCGLNNKNINIITYCFDITNSQKLSQVVNEILLEYKIDILIANAGVSAGTLGGLESLEQTNTIIATNINGVVSVVGPISNQMKNLGSGSICIISSIAGLIALPSTPTYSASKSFVKIYGEALRAELRQYGVFVSVICPGYIKTPMTDVNQFKMPFLMDVSKASKKIIKAIDKNVGFLSFPLIMFLVVKLFHINPFYKMRDFILARLPKKSSININIKSR